MKAILEFETPASCWECVAYHATDQGCFCDALEVRLYGIKYLTERLRRCPLKIDAEEKKPFLRRSHCAANGEDQRCSAYIRDAETNQCRYRRNWGEWAECLFKEAE